MARQTGEGRLCATAGRACLINLVTLGAATVGVCSIARLPQEDPVRDPPVYVRCRTD